MRRKKKKESPYWRYENVKRYQQDYNKSYYLANRAKIIAEQKKRNADNEKALAEYYKKYYAENKQKLLDYAKKRRKNGKR